MLLTKSMFVSLQYQITNAARQNKNNIMANQELISKAEIKAAAAADANYAKAAAFAATIADYEKAKAANKAAYYDYKKATSTANADHTRAMKDYYATLNTATSNYAKSTGNL